MAGFHSVHGRGVELVRKSEYDDEEEEEEKERDDVLEVRRLRGAEDERVAFSSAPVEIGRAYQLLLNFPNSDVHSGDGDSSGVITVGLSFLDPAAAGSRKHLVEFDGDGTTEAEETKSRGGKKGIWTLMIGGQFFRPGNNILSICLTANGEFFVCVNNRPVGTDKPGLSAKDDKPMWLAFVLSGSAERLRFRECDKDIPVEILARGREACESYQRVLREDSLVIQRGRICLVGPERSGKTCLSSTLFGEEPRSTSHLLTEAMEIGPTCRISKDGKWETLKRIVEDPSLEDDKNEHLAHRTATSVASASASSRRALANSSSSSSKTPSSASASSKRESMSARIFNRVFSGGGGNGVKPGSESSDETVSSSHPPPIPPEVIPLVEEYLYRSREGKDIVQDQEEEEEDERGSDNHGADLNEEGGEEGPLLATVWDFGGHRELMGCQHIFVQDEPVYVVTFDLSLDLDAEAQDSFIDENGEVTKKGSGGKTNLDSVVDWIRLVGHKSRMMDMDGGEGDRSAVQPRIVVVGTHKDKLHKVEVMQLSMANFKFERLMEDVRKSGLEHLVSFPFFAVDATRPCRAGNGSRNSEGDGEDDQDLHSSSPGNCGCSLCPLKRRLHLLLRRRVGPGRRVPRRWLRLEEAAAAMTKRGVHFANRTELREVGASIDEGDLEAMLSFYSSVGILLSWRKGTAISEDDCEEEEEDLSPLSQLVALSPQRLATLLTRTTSNTFARLARVSLKSDDGFLNGEEFDALSSSADFLPEAAKILLGTLGIIFFDEGADDVFSPLLPGTSSASSRAPLLRKETELTVVFSFQDGAPAALFPLMCVHLLQSRSRRRKRATALAANSSQDLNKTLPPLFTFEGGDRLALNLEHGYRLDLRRLGKEFRCGQLAMTVSRRKGAVKRDGGYEDHHNGNEMPSPQVCLSLLREVESSLSRCCSLWFPRLQSASLAPCPCDNNTCEEHQRLGCTEQGCAHCLDLRECLQSPVVLCNFRKVDTDFIRRFFPSDATAQNPLVPSSSILGGLYGVAGGGGGEGMGLRDGVILSPLQLTSTSSEAIRSPPPPPQSPKWLKGAAKLLESGFEGEDWRALAELLGYKTKKIEELDDSLQPAKWLFKDWLSSSGNTKLSVEMLCACLEDMKRHDVVEVIMDVEKEESDSPHQVFISYHWDSQDQVLLLRSALELSGGLTCWMDVGQVGGGDLLHARIYAGISACQVFLACVSPRYAVSDSCCRELALADLLRKPIIPVMAERTPWPVPGPAALLLSQLVYVDLAGTGGHGGAGRHADWAAKVEDLAARIRSYLQVLDPQEQREAQQRRRRRRQQRMMEKKKALQQQQQDSPAEAAEVGGGGTDGDEEGFSRIISSDSDSESVSSSSTSSAATSRRVAAAQSNNNPLAWIAAASAAGSAPPGGGGGRHQMHHLQYQQHHSAWGGGRRRRDHHQDRHQMTCCCGISNSCQIM